MHQHGSAQPGAFDFIKLLCTVFGVDIVREKLKTQQITLLEDLTFTPTPDDATINEFLLKEFQQLAPNIIEQIKVAQQGGSIPMENSSHSHMAHSPARDDIETITKDSHTKPQSHEWFESISGHVVNEQLFHINPNF